MTKLLGDVVMDNELAAHNALGFRIATPLDAAGFPELAHLSLEGGDDRLKKLLLIWQRLLLSKFQAVVRTLTINHGGG